MMLSKVMMKLVMDDGRDRRFMQPAHNDESDPRLFQTGVRTAPHASCSWLTRSPLLVHLFNVSNVMQLAHDI